MLTGSLCISDIPRELIKKVKCKDGKERIYVNFAVIERKEPITFGDRTFTHFLTVAPRKEERKEGVNYIVADLQTYTNTTIAPSTVEIEAAPPINEGDLPF